MPGSNGFCLEHSGCVKSIKHLEKANVEQWDHMEKQGDRINTIFMRINIILGGITVSCILLLVNLLLK